MQTALQPTDSAHMIVACVSPSPLSGHVVRTARRLADQLDCGWRAVYVETPASHDRPPHEKHRALEHLRLAEHLGAETEIVQHQSISDGLIEAAHRFEAATLVVGQPARRGWRDLFRASLVDRIVRKSRGLELFVVSGQEADGSSGEETSSDRQTRSVPPRQWLAALGVVGVSTGVGLGIRRWVADVDIVMVFLLGVMFVAYRMRRLPALFSALLSVAAFDFFFVTPHLTLTVHNLNHVLTFAVMAVVGLAISGLTARVKRQAEAARRREQSTAALYRFARRLALATAPDELLETAAGHIRQVFDTSVAIYRMTGPDEETTVAARLGDPPELETDHPAIREAYTTGEPAGASTPAVPGAKGFYLPIEGVNDRVGVLGVVPSHHLEFSDPERRDLLDAHADQIGLFFERLRLSNEARETQLALETERVRNAVLSSVSHDLRTPLGSIMGSASTLIDADDQLDSADRRRLAETVYTQSRRLDRLLENLLKMTQIEGQTLEVDAEWQMPAEIIGSALSHLEPELADREVSIRVSDERRMARFDGPLIEQVLVNLLENAIQYTPPDSPIEVRAEYDDERIRFAVADRGAGVPAEDRDRIFEKFRQGRTDSEGGTGLGLTICRAIVEAHGGTIAAADRSNGTGAVFEVTLPQSEPPPVEPPAADDGPRTSRREEA